MRNPKARLAIAALLLTCSLSAATLDTAELYWSKYYIQAGPAQPVTPDVSIFEAYLYLQSDGDFDDANLTLPGGSMFAMSMYFPAEFEHYVEEADESVFNSTYGAGTYSFGATDSTGSNPDAPASLTVDYLNGFATSVPYLTNYSALQGVNAGLPVEVTWNPFTGAIDDPCGCSGIFFLITRASDDAVVEFQFLPTSVTSHTIDPGWLEPGTEYKYLLVFSNETETEYASGTGVQPALFGFDLITTGAFTTAVPEPGTAILSGVGALLLVRRRRRHV